MIMLKQSYGFIGLFFIVLLLAGCRQETAVPNETAVAETVSAAVAATRQVEQATADAVAAVLEPSWTPPPAIVFTATPQATMPPPPTSTPLPTDTPEVMETEAPTETPEPTETAIATNPPPAAQPTQPPAQPTQPPPPPTAPPNPTFGANILPNGSFEDGWYNMNGIPELQLPNGWGFEWDEGATGFGTERWDVWVRPETRVLPDFQLPANERSLFIRDGQYTIKMFKGNGAISYRVFQDVTLQPGTYLFQVNIFPDLVSGYNGGQKVWAGDPLSGEVRFIAPDGGTGWILPAFGRWNTLEHTFSIAEAQTVRIGVGIRGRYALPNNGWFFDEWTLRQLQ